MMVKVQRIRSELSLDFSLISATSLHFIFYYSIWPIGVVFSGYNPTWWSSVAQLASHHLNIHENRQSFTYGGMEAKLQPMSALKTPAPLAATSPSCTQLAGLSPGQARVCDLFADHMSPVGLGARRAIEECQYQFKGRRWNCSMPYGSPVMGPVHDTGTKEAAFTFSLVAAAVTWEVSRSCRQGLLQTCTCNQEPRPAYLAKEFLWGGCGDNVEYGYQFAQNFIDVRERERETEQRSKEYGRTLMNRWNNEVGRKTIKRLSRVACKCHGVSGACNLKTCWKQMPDLREVGSFLYQRYNEAVRVKLSRRGNLKMARGSRKRRAAKLDLVYLDDSPDYCRPNPENGSPGTEGRPCNRTARALLSDSCETLCCGRGYNTMKRVIVEKCQCKFHWCCKVQCRTCQTRVELHTCK